MGIPQAAEEFRQAIVGMFGEQARTQPILFCRKATVNQTTVYIGNTEQLQQFLTNNEESRKQLGIKKLIPHGFVTSVVDGKGNESTKKFMFSDVVPPEMYALYTKKGWETMACIKPLVQFLAECELHGDDLFAKAKADEQATKEKQVKLNSCVNMTSSHPGYGRELKPAHRATAERITRELRL